MPDLLSRVESGVSWLTLNRPAARNALSDDLRTRLLAGLREAAADPATRVVVIRGAGGAFCSGADRSDLGAGPERTASMLERGREIVTAIAELPKPVVAAVEGPAAGAGISLAAACDLVVAAEGSVLHPAFTRVGLAPDWALTHWLVRSIGLHRAKDVLLTGRPLPVEEARELGLVARVWPRERFESELAALVDDLACGPTAAYGVTKRLVAAASSADLAASLGAEALGALFLSGTADHAEVVQALQERRAPLFTGR